MHNSLLIGKVYSRKSEVIFRVDSHYYQNKKLVYRSHYPVVYQKKNIYLPRDILEVILLKIIDKDIVYQENQKEIRLIAVSPRQKIIPEKIALKRIIIDAGHGGHDPGAISDEAVPKVEKKINLKVARLLAFYLKRRFPHLKVFLTRNKDRFVKLGSRTRMANQKLQDSNSTIFISLHCNSGFNKEAKGYEIYYLDQTQRMETSREYSIIEYRLVPTHYKPNIVWIQSGMMSSLIQRRSIKLAKQVHYAMGKQIGRYIPSRGVKRANFHVLRRSLMPAILVEMGFVSNVEENKLLTNTRVQLRIVKGIANGIKAYIKTKDRP